MLAAHFGSEKAAAASGFAGKSGPSGFVLEEPSEHRRPEKVANDASPSEAASCLRGEEVGSDCDTNQISS
jgi:hypothetical protein